MPNSILGAGRKALFGIAPDEAHLEKRGFAATTLRMRQELARILEERPRTVVLVTHDIEEAAQLADRVIVLSECPGQIRYHLNIAAARPRDPTQWEVVRAMHLILSELNIEHNEVIRRK